MQRVLALKIQWNKRQLRFSWLTDQCNTTLTFRRAGGWCDGNTEINLVFRQVIVFGEVVVAFIYLKIKWRNSWATPLTSLVRMMVAMVAETSTTLFALAAIFIIPFNILVETVACPFQKHLPKGLICHPCIDGSNLTWWKWQCGGVKEFR